MKANCYVNFKKIKKKKNYLCINSILVSIWMCELWLMWVLNLYFYMKYFNNPTEEEMKINLEEEKYYKETKLTIFEKITKKYSDFENKIKNFAFSLYILCFLFFKISCHCHHNIKLYLYQ
jgi:hypothetical protein